MCARACVRAVVDVLVRYVYGCACVRAGVRVRVRARAPARLHVHPPQRQLTAALQREAVLVVLVVLETQCVTV